MLHHFVLAISLVGQFYAWIFAMGGMFSILFWLLVSALFIGFYPSEPVLRRRLPPLLGFFVLPTCLVFWGGWNSCEKAPACTAQGVQPLATAAMLIMLGLQATFIVVMVVLLRRAPVQGVIAAIVAAGLTFLSLLVSAVAESGVSF